MPSHYGKSIPHHVETKGSVSKTHKGDLDYTTKKSSRDFHRHHHDILRPRRPFHKLLTTQLHKMYRH